MNSAVYFPNESFFQRKKYTQRSGVQDSGGLYESAITALVALRATLDDDVLDMWVASNGEHLGAFDDLILHVEHEPLRKKTYVVQLKHKENYTIVKSSFTNPRESFYLKKYVEDYHKIKDRLSNGDAYLSDFFSNNNLNDVNFVMYTNSDFKKDTSQFPIGDGVTLKRVSHRDILNTGTDGGCVYMFSDNNNNNNADFYEKFYFYTKQSRAENLENLIYEEIQRKFGDVDVAIAKEIIGFFDDWAAGKTNGHFALTKDEMKIKLFELLITPHVVEPRITNHFDDIASLVRILDEVDVVIVEDSTSVSYTYFAIKSIMEEFLGGLIINWENWSTVYVKLVGLNSASAKSLYIALWKLGIIPLVVNIDEELNKILKGLRLHPDYRLRLVILSNRFHKFEHLTPYKKFTTLSDLEKNTILDVTKNIDISLQGRVTMALSELMDTDDTITKYINSTILLKMLMEKITIGEKPIDPPEMYITRYLSNSYLSMRVLKYLRQNLFIISGDRDNISVLKGIKLRINNLRQLTSFRNRKRNVVIWEKGLPFDLDDREDCGKLLETFQGIHLLRYHPWIPNAFEWLQTWGNARILSKFVINKLENKLKLCEKSVTSYTDRKVNIVSAEPGMGKSIFMNNISNSSDIQDWILTINLNDFTSDLKSNIDNPLDYFYRKIETTQNSLTDAIFDFFKSRKQITVLFDGFDEITPTYTKNTLKIIKWFVKNEYKVWVTSRITTINYLQSSLNALSYKLEPFSVDEIDEYLKKYNGEKIPQSDFVEYVRKILSNNVELMGNPLQIKMSVDYVKQNGLNNRKIDIVDLYENFINEKLNWYWKKANWEPTNTIFIDETKERNLTLIKIHQKLSLKLFYTDDDLKQINMKKVDLFVKNFHKGKKNVGIIANFVKNRPNFGHQTYAEYLTGTWLAKYAHKEKIKTLLPKIFTPEFTFIREIFDRILCKNSELHTAILNRDAEHVRIFSNVHVKDLAGRSPLHLTASYGNRHHSNDYKEGDEHYVETKNQNCEEIFEILLGKDLNPYDKDALMDWNAFDYALNTSSLNLIEILYRRGFDYNLDEVIPVDLLIFFCSSDKYPNIQEKLNIKLGKSQKRI